MQFLNNITTIFWTTLLQQYLYNIQTILGQYLNSIHTIDNPIFKQYLNSNLANNLTLYTLFVIISTKTIPGQYLYKL